MKKNKKIKIVKIVVVCVIACLIVWFLMLKPFIEFKDNEKQMKLGAERYVELNKAILPTNGNVKTIPLDLLYQKKFVSTLYIPYTKSLCNVNDSWVKVKNENGNYKYYIYLKCGVYASVVDHVGPTIKLNGDEVMTLSKGDTYKEPGVNSVSDNSFGKINTDKVKITGTVNTKKIGKYVVTYTVSDDLSNKTIKTRTVNVIQKLSDTITKDTGTTNTYKGNVANNYLNFSGMLFRIVGTNKDGSIKLVTDDDIASVNHNKAEEWLNNYFYNHLSNNSKTYMVKSDYCQDQGSDLTKTTCTKTKQVNVSMLSLSDYNNAIDNNNSYLYTSRITWLADSKNNSNSWTTRLTDYSDSYNYAIRPVISLKKDTLVRSGNGTKSNPYMIGDYKIAKAQDKLNSRISGEYVKISGYMFRIMEVNSDNSIKMIMSSTIYKNSENIQITYNKDAGVYNVNKEGSILYQVNNNIASYIKTSYFVNKKTEVPIYKNYALYNEEESTKNYKIKLAIPGLYEMFSAANSNTPYESYWLKDSSKNSSIKYLISNNGSVYNEIMLDNDKAGVKLVVNLNKNSIIKEGKGTYDNPYILTN